MDERQKASDDYWKGKRFLSDKVIAGKLIMDGHTEATEQDFINADNLAKSNLSLGASDYWRKNLEETGKTMAGLYGSFDSSMIKEEDLTDENGERYKKYTTNVFGKKSLVVRKNKPIVPADNTRVQLPNVPSNLPANVNLSKPQNQIQQGQIPAMNTKLGKTAENTATASQASNDMSNNLSVNENLQNVQANIFNHVPVGPDNIENLMKENIKEARQIRNINFPKNYLTFKNLVEKGGKWDYKTSNGFKFEDFGNFHYGVVGMAAGFSEKELLGFAGLFHKVDNGIFAGGGIPFISVYNGDDGRDQRQIRAGIEWYKRNKGYFE